MTIKVQLSWTNSSKEALNQRVEADLGAGYVKVADVAIAADHTNATPYTYVYAPAVEASQDIYYRIVTEGGDGEEIGNVITLNVPVEGAIAPVSDLTGDVVEDLI